MKAAFMSPVSGLEIYPLNSPHVSDFIAGLFIPSCVHICPHHQATAKFYFYMSGQHLSYDHRCLLKVIKCKLSTSLSFWHFSAYLKHCSYKDYCVITWAQHIIAWLQFVRLSSFFSVGHSHEELC